MFSANFNVLASWLPGGSETPYIRTLNPTSPTVDEEPAEGIGTGSKKLSDKLSWIIHVPQPDNYDTSLSYVMAIIQISVNWVLWLLS